MESEPSRSAMVWATLRILKYERAERLSFSEALYKNCSAGLEILSKVETWWEVREEL